MTEKSDGPRLIEVAAGIIWRGGRFLAAQRPTDKPLEGYWEFPTHWIKVIKAKSYYNF